jgi:hypothetical protein
MPLRAWDHAFKRFFANIKVGRKPWFPRLKKKDVRDSFALGSQAEINLKRWYL